MTAWSDIVIALISAITGGGLLKLVDTWLNRTKIRNENAKQLRDETRTEVTDLKQRVRDLEDRVNVKEEEIDTWRKKYWDVYMTYKMFKLEVAQILVDHGINPKELFTDDT